ncbi:MAG: hypothetical protein PW734_11320, partial [Verrucomicrobium sp.]|nr:hypothetical protein [Verrucomicrobium sp.]
MAAETLPTYVTGVYPPQLMYVVADIMRLVAPPSDLNPEPGIPFALWSHVFNIARLLAGFALTLRIIMAGFSIMFGQGARTFSDQFFDIIIKGVLLWFFVFSGSPGTVTPISTAGSGDIQTIAMDIKGGRLPLAQTWIKDAVSGVWTAGEKIAAEIGAPCYKADETNWISLEPPVYWANYIMGKEPNSSSSESSTKPWSGIKFSFPWIIHNMFNWDDGFRMYSQFIEYLGILALASPVADATFGGGNFVFTSMVIGFLISIVMGTIGIGLFAFTTVIGLMIMALFAWLGSLIAPVIVFYLVMLLGMAVLPLILFKRFESMWANYFVFLTGAALCIFFYYVTSAVGYRLATGTFEYIFLTDYPTNFDSLGDPDVGQRLDISGTGVSNSTGQGMFAAFWGATNVFQYTTGTNNVVTAQYTPGYQSNSGSVPFSALGLCFQLLPISSIADNMDPPAIFRFAPLKNIFAKTYDKMGQGFDKLMATLSGRGLKPKDFIITASHALLAEGAWAAGIGILAAFISGGITLGALGPAFAFAWADGFVAKEAIKEFQTFFQKVGGATASGMRAAANSGVQRIAQGGSFITQLGGQTISRFNSRLNS